MGKRISYEVTENDVRLLYGDGSAKISVWRDDIIRVFCPHEGRGTRSKAIGEAGPAPTEFTVTDEGDALVICTSKLLVKVYDGFYVDFYRVIHRKDGGTDLAPLCREYRGERTLRATIDPKILDLIRAEGHNVAHIVEHNYPVQTVRIMDGDEKFYGLGDKTGFLNKRYYDYENWNTDDPHAHTEAFKALYKSVPFLITLKDQGVFGIFFDNTCRSRISLGRERSDYYYYGAEGGDLDYYFILGDDMPGVVSGYAYLTGTTPLPQLWTLGYHQSRMGYANADDVREVTAKFRELRIPCDTIHFDLDYMDGYRVFTWNEEGFGRPGELLSEIAQDGFKVVPIIDPGVKKEEGYYVYDEGVREGCFVKDADGENYVNVVWPGEVSYPDFGSPKVRDWWSGKQKYLADLGFAGVWNDMNEPASFRGELPEDLVFTDGDQPSTHAAMHNCYGHLMSQATYEGIKKATGKRPFVITRACYSGTQKYATVWTGDNQSLWAHLQMAVPQLCNLGLSGFSIAGTDVGGFGENCTPELLCRWVQVGAFSTLFRNHSPKNTLRQEPWQFDEQTLRINRKFIELRYRLLPYFYDLFYEGERTGLPVMRPLVLHYESDPQTWNLNGEFLIGERLLVAPVLEQGAVKKAVYLPAGTWYDFFTGAAYEGGRYYLVDAPLDTCPMFVKGGSMIPTYEVVQYVGERPYDVLKLLVYPGEGSYVHYQDNGTDFSYRDGSYNLYEFIKESDGTVTHRMLHEGYEPYRKIEYITV